jgi:hypothetical protein
VVPGAGLEKYLFHLKGTEPLSLGGSDVGLVIIATELKKTQILIQSKNRVSVSVPIDFKSSVVQQPSRLQQQTQYFPRRINS